MDVRLRGRSVPEKPQMALDAFFPLTIADGLVISFKEATLNRFSDMRRVRL
jgi:hypothetical protein